MSHGMVAKPPVADGDELRIGPRQQKKGRMHEIVISHHVRTPYQGQSLPREQHGIAWPCSDQVHNS
jgi:hypothetical protein